MSDEEFYEQFHRKSGDYLMPDRVFEDLLYEKEELEKENKKLKKKLEKLQKPQIFIDTQDIEERYAEGKYQDYLEEQVKELKKQLEDMTDCRDIASGHRKEVQDRETILLNQQQEFIKYLEDEIYSIEPKGTGINYNCEYDSEEDYINAMKEMTKLITLKAILQKYKEIIASDINVGSKGGNK